MQYVKVKEKIVEDIFGNMQNISDQMASVEPGGLIKLVKGVRDIEKAMTGYGPRRVMGSELKKRKSLITTKTFIEIE